MIGDAEGGERATGHEHLFPGLHDLDELGRVGVPIHPVAGLLHGQVPVCMATSPCARAGTSLATVAGHRYQPSAHLVLADELELRLRRGLGEEVIDQLQCKPTCERTGDLLF